MSAGTPPSFDQAFATLRQFARAPRPAERCELCSAALAHEHPHLVEISLRQIVCACEACATLFDGMASGKYRRVSRRAQLLANFQIDRRAVGKPPDPHQHGVLLPIAAWKEKWSHSTPALPELWNPCFRSMPGTRSCRRTPSLASCNPISRRCSSTGWVTPTNGRRPSTIIAPIDECYKLVGLIRANWKGLSGGAEVWAEIGRFFSALRAQADIISVLKSNH